MFIKLKKAQSASEYAILLSGIIAALTFIQTIMSGSVKKKAQQALTFYDKAGNNVIGETKVLPKYEMSQFQTNIASADRRSERVIHKGGAVESETRQTSLREGISVELDRPDDLLGK